MLDQASHTRKPREVVRLLFFSLVCTALAAALAAHWRRPALPPGGAIQPQQLRQQRRPQVPRHAFPITGAASDPPSPILATDFGGVRHYSLPCELPAADGGNGSVPGVLHIYLKALRWPQPRSGGDETTHHLRLKGFAAFEFFKPPENWKRHYTFSNVPEVALTMRLMLRGPPTPHKRPRQWKLRRRVPLEFV